MQIGRPIQTWRYDYAPLEYQRLSEFGGNETWVALVPRDVWKSEGGVIPWMEAGSHFGTQDVADYELDSGDIVLIGAERT